MAAETEVERLIVRLIGDGSKYQAMLAQAEVATKHAEGVIGKTVTKIERLKLTLNSIGSGFQKVGQGMRRVGMRMSLAVTAPLLIMGGVATHSFAQFDQAMTESTSIMKVTEAQIDSMRTTALKLSADGKVLQGPEDLAKSYFYLASAGKDAEQSMALLPSVSAFATAGAFDMALATDLLTDAQSALGLASKDIAQDTINMARVSDVLVKANTLANASVQQFSTALTSKAGAAMKSFDIEMEQGVAVLAAFADQGIKAELAGNNFSRMMLLMSKSSRDNKAAFEKYNFKMFDDVGNVRDMADIIQNLEQAVGKLSPELRTAALAELGFDARVQGAILPLIGTSENIRRYTKELRLAKGITEEVAEKQMKSFTNQLKVMKNQITVVAIEIGEMLAPMILGLNTYLQSGIHWWKLLSPEIKRSIVTIALIVGAIGPLLMVLGSLVSFLGFVVAGFGSLIGVVVGLFSPLTLVVALVAGLLYQLDAGGKSLDWFKGKWQSLITYLGPAIQGIKDALAADDITLAFEIAWVQIKLVWAKGIQSLTDTWHGFNSLVGNATINGLSAVELTWIAIVAKVKEYWVLLARGAGLMSQGQSDAEVNVIKGQAFLETFDAKRRAKGTSKAFEEDTGRLIGETVNKISKLENELKGLTGKAKGPRDVPNSMKFPNLADYIDQDPGIAAANEALEDLQEKAKIKISFSTIDAAGAGSAEAMSRLSEFQSLRGLKTKRPEVPSGVNAVSGDVPNAQKFPNLQDPIMSRNLGVGISDVSNSQKFPDLQRYGITPGLADVPDRQKFPDMQRYGVGASDVADSAKFPSAEFLSGKGEPEEKQTNRIASALETLVAQGIAAAEKSERNPKELIVSGLN